MYYLGRHSGTAKASGRWFGYICALTLNRWGTPEVRKFFVVSEKVYNDFHFDLGLPLSCSFDADGRLVSAKIADGEPLIVPEEFANELDN